ncbi:MAG TPA: NAD-binding protein [Chloroflexia bacterium]|nr:NAD-binding protein [Chloroflexia bacterium]
MTQEFKNPSHPLPEHSAKPTDNNSLPLIPYNQLDALYAQAMDLSGHVIVCGLNTVGYRIVKQLLEAEVRVVVVDENPDPNFSRVVQAKGVFLLTQDSRSDEALKQVRIEKALAIIAVADTDLKNLETVLAAHELAPDIRAVTSFFNPQIGERLRNSIPNAYVLNLAELTAPTFVTACLPSQVLHLFELGPEEFAVVRDLANNAGTFQQLYGDRVTPLLRLNKKQEVQVCPRPNTMLEANDHVAVVGKVEELERLAEVELDRKAVEEARHSWKTGKQKSNRVVPKPLQARERRNKEFSLSLITLLREVDRPFKVALLTIILVLLGSVFFYLFFNHERTNGDPLNAFYLTMISMSGNAGLDDLPNWYNKLFASALIAVGATILAIVYTSLTNYIVTARLRQLMGSDGREKARRLKGHVVVCGLGRIGYRVVCGLVERGQEVAVLERDEKNRFSNLVRSMGVPVLNGDMRLPESLELVNIAKARCLVSFSSDDSVNLETALNALQRNPDLRVVLRLFDARLAERVEKNFNIQIARSTSALAAPYFIGAALNFEVVTSFYVGQLPFFIAKLVIQEDGALNGKTVRDLYTSRGVSVLAYVAHAEKVDNLLEGAILVRQQVPVYHPGPDFKLYAGDTVYLLGDHRRIAAVYQLNRSPS